MKGLSLKYIHFTVMRGPVISKEWGHASTFKYYLRKCPTCKVNLSVCSSIKSDYIVASQIDIISKNYQPIKKKKELLTPLPSLLQFILAGFYTKKKANLTCKDLPTVNIQKHYVTGCWLYGKSSKNTSAFLINGSIIIIN